MDPKPISEVTTAALTQLTEPSTTSRPPVLADWRPVLDAHDDSLRAAAEAARRFVADMDAGAEPYWLTFLGAFGCGKTMLARQIFEAAKRINPGNPANNPIWPPNWATRSEPWYSGQRPNCFYFDEKELAKRVGGGEYDLPEQVREDFFVCLDEVGFSRDPSNFVSEVVARLAQARLRGWTVFCSNLSLAEIATRIDGRVMSRLVRDENRVLTITAKDYAIVKRTR